MLLVIQNNPHEVPGLIGELASARGWHINGIHAYAGADVPVAPPSDCSLVLILGGQQAVYEQQQYPYLAAEIRLIQSCLARAQPILGICLGAQLIAAALGAEVVPGATREIGWLPVQFEHFREIGKTACHMPDEQTVFHFHGDCMELPAGATLLASSAITPCQAFRHGKSTLAFQYHPEVDSNLAATMLKENAAYVDQAGVSVADEIEASALYLADSRKLHRHFFECWLDDLVDA